MTYISTYRVLRKSIISVTIPSVIFLIVSVGTSIFLISDENYVKIILTLLSVFCFVVYYQHLQLNWLIWAVKHVDNIPQLAKAGEIYGLTRYKGFPKIWTIIPFREKKIEIEEIVSDRKSRNLFVIKYDTPDVSEVHFYRSLIKCAISLLFGLSILAICIFSPFENKYALIIKLIGSVIGFYFVFWSLEKILEREPIFSIGKNGVMLENKYFEWNEIENIDVEETIEGIGKGRHIRRYLNLVYKEKEAEVQTIKIDIGIVNSTIEKIDEVIKSYKADKMHGGSQRRKKLKISN